MKIYEVLSDRSVADIHKDNGAIMDQQTIGKYTVALLKIPVKYREITGTRYDIAIEKESASFTDVSQQYQKFMSKDENLDFSSLKSIGDVITNWVNIYGDDGIAVGSNNAKKTQTYKKILTRLGIPFETKFSDIKKKEFLLLK